MKPTTVVEPVASVDRSVCNETFIDRASIGKLVSTVQYNVLVTCLHISLGLLRGHASLSAVQQTHKPIGNSLDSGGLAIINTNWAHGRK